MGRHRRYSLFFKRQLVEEYLEGRSGMTELSRWHGIERSLIRLWVKKYEACNLGNFLPTRALPGAVEHWSLTTLREKLIKIGTKVVRHGRDITLQLAKIAIL